MTSPSAWPSPQGEVRLRPYQEHGISECDARIAAGARRLLLVAATGAGKTTLAAFIIVRAIARGQHVLFLAHRRELIAQAYQRLVDLGVPEEQLGVIMGTDPRRRPAAPVQVASVDTLRHRAKPHANIVFVDEAHRSLAKSYGAIAAAFPDAIHLGLTATPYRADGQGLGDAYDELIVVATPRQLIADGFLVEPRVLTVPPSALPDLSRVRVRGGDYAEGALDEAVNQRALVGNIVEHWTRHAADLRTVVFAVSVAHSLHVIQRFRDAGIAAEHLDGATPTPDRAAILTRLDRGETRVVSNCAILGEGFDLPSLKCAVLGRPTKSTGLYLQQVGRILRPWRGEGAIVLDHAGCAIEHGLPHEDREFSLDGTRSDEPHRRRLRPRICTACFTVVARGVRACPTCREDLGAPAVMPEETAHELVEATIALSRPIRRQAHDGREHRHVVDALRRAVRQGGQLDWGLLDAARAGPLT